MKIKTRCGHCGKVYQMDDNYLGQIAQCRNCQKHFTMAPFEDQPGSEPSTAPGRPQPKKKKSKKGCFFKLLAFLLLFTLLAAGALTAGLKFFPDFFKKLGFSNLVALLPF
jgi:hypothetical protein